MVMTYDGALVMPSSYAVMNEEEMTYVEGGAPDPIYVHKGLLDKVNCNRIAGYYTEETGLSTTRLREEIYAHAVMYYASPALLGGYVAAIAPLTGVLGVAAVLATLNWIRSHSNPINLGGDSNFRVAVYKAIWTIC